MLAVFGWMGCGGVTVLTALTGVLLLLLKGNPVWRLFTVSFTAGTITLGTLAAWMLSDTGTVFLGGWLLAIAVVSLWANALWCRARLKAVPSDLDAPVREDALERLGRRLWFPYAGGLAIVGVVIALAASNALPL